MSSNVAAFVSSTRSSESGDQEAAARPASTEPTISICVWEDGVSSSSSFSVVLVVVVGPGETRTMSPPARTRVVESVSGK